MLPATRQEAGHGKGERTDRDAAAARCVARRAAKASTTRNAFLRASTPPTHSKTGPGPMPQASRICASARLGSGPQVERSMPSCSAAARRHFGVLLGDLAGDGAAGRQRLADRAELAGLGATPVADAGSAGWWSRARRGHQNRDLRIGAPSKVESAQKRGRPGKPPALGLDLYSRLSRRGVQAARSSLASWP